MVGKIHPFGVNTNEIKDYKLVDLVWIAWDNRRPHENCIVCRYVRDWRLELMLQKWDQNQYNDFHEFTDELLNGTNYDEFLNRVSSARMDEVQKLFIKVDDDGWENSFFFNHRIVNF